MQLFQQSEATAARRRIFLHLVDATNGITAETGVTGTGFVSKNGAAPAATSGSLVEISAANMPGRYYIELIAAEIDGLGIVEVRFKSAATAEAIARGQVVPWDPYDAVRQGMTALPNAAAEAAGGLFTRGTGAGQINQAANGQIDVNAARLNNVLQSLLDLVDFVDAGYDPVTNKVQGVVLVDTTTTNTDMRGTDSAALASVLGALADAAAAGDPTSADTLVQYVKQLVNLLAGSAGIATMPTGLDPANGVNLFEMLRAAMGATFAQATDSLEALRDRGDAAWITGGGGADPALLQNTTIATLTSQVSFTLTDGSGDDDAYNDQTIVITDSATATQKAVGVVDDYVGSAKAVALRDDPAIFTMAVGDTVDIVASAALKPTAFGRTLTVEANGMGHADLKEWLGVAPLALVAQRIAANAQVVGDKTGYTLTAAEQDAIVDKIWDELQSGHLTAGTFGLFLDAAITGRLAPTVAGRTLDVSATGEADANIVTWLGVAVSALIAGRVDANAQVIGTDAVDAVALNADAVDEIWNEILTELSVGIPSATPTARAALMLMFMALRNKLDIDSSFMEIHNDAGVIITKKALSDDATTYSEAEMESG